MTAGELAVLLAAVLCCIGFAALIVVLMRVLDSLEGAARRSRITAQRDPPAAGRAQLVHRGCQGGDGRGPHDLDRFDRVLGSAEAISGAVAGGSRVARAALSAPVIKTVAIGTGTKRAVRRLRRKEKKIA
jgi:hypothetical protein